MKKELLKLIPQTYKRLLGFVDQHVQTITHRINKQKGPTLQHRELCSISCDKP